MLFSQSEATSLCRTEKEPETVAAENPKYFLAGLIELIERTLVIKTGNLRGKHLTLVFQVRDNNSTNSHKYQHMSVD